MNRQGGKRKNGNIEAESQSTDEVPSGDGENSIKIGGLNLHNIVVAGEEKLEQGINDQSTDNRDPHDRPVDEFRSVIDGTS